MNLFSGKFKDFVEWHLHLHYAAAASRSNIILTYYYYIITYFIYIIDWVYKIDGTRKEQSIFLLLWLLNSPCPEQHRWRRWPLRSCCPSETSERSRHCPRTSTRSSSRASISKNTFQHEATNWRIITTDLSIQLPVADSQHRVIQAVNVTAALLLEVNSIGVEAEAFVRSINSNGHWTMGGDGDLGWCEEVEGKCRLW